jgi:hypothetical protein
MPVLTGKRTRLVVIFAAASVPPLLAGGAAVISALIAQRCSGALGAVAYRAEPTSSRARSGTFWWARDDRGGS